VDGVEDVAVEVELWSGVFPAAGAAVPGAVEVVEELCAELLL